jgi:hypothetical protein
LKFSRIFQSMRLVPGSGAPAGRQNADRASAIALRHGFGGNVF